MEKTLRDYQTKAIDAALAQERFALIVLASGLGKTLTSAVFAKKWWSKNKKRILFLVDKNEPIDDQAMPVFEEVFRKTGLSMKKFTGRSKQPVKTDIVFATLQTMRKHLRRFKRGAFGLVIVDECHHGQAMTYRDVITYFRAQFRLGLTATPDRADGLDIREIFGEEVFSYTLAEAIADGWWLAAVDYRVLFDNVDVEKLRTLMARVHGGDRTITHKMIDKVIFLPERIDEIVRKILAEQRKGGKKTIIFCNSKDHLRLVQKRIARPRAEAYHSGIPRRVLKERLAEFRSGKLKILLTVDKMNEAIDIPDAELIVFLRSTESETVWKQQLGRGLRRADGKKCVVVLDFVVNCKRFFMVSRLQKQTPPPKGKEHRLLLKTGWQFTFVERAVDMVELLDYLELELYPTWEAASGAARALGIKDQFEYRARLNEDRQLPSNPNTFYKNVWEARGRWPGFLGLEARRRTNVYESFEEAAKAAQALAVRDRDDYRAKYRQDPFLPGDPSGRYAEVWKERGGWPAFLGKKKYSYQEAALRARELEIKTSSEYADMYRTDACLPCTPHQAYPGVWKKRGGWRGFLGTLADAYTYGQAANAARRLGFRSSKEYDKRYREDPLLPSSPDETYSAIWMRRGGWHGFLGIQRYSYTEASETVQVMGIRTRAEYLNRYREDPMLASAPSERYASIWKRKGGWPGFLGREK